jgi:alpha-mannosidase
MKRLLLLLAFFVTPALSQTDYIRDWLILGVFPRADELTRLSFDYLNGESSIVARGGEVLVGQRWMLYHSPREFVDFLWSEFPFAVRERCAVYAAFFVQSPKDQRVHLLVGSDDGVVVWCNGQQVHYNDVYRDVVLDNDTAAVQFKSGWNTILLKIVNGEVGYGACARFADGDGLVLSAENPFPPTRSLTPASLSCASTTLNFRFSITENHQLAFSFDLPLLNRGSTAVRDVEVVLMSSNRTIAKSVVPKIAEGELFRFQQRAAFHDALEVSGGKVPLSVHLRYEGKDTTQLYEFAGEVLRKFFEPWGLQGWTEKRVDEKSARFARTVVVPAELSGLGLQVAVDIGETWGSVSVNGERKLARFSGDSGELTLTDKSGVRDTFNIEVAVTSDKPIRRNVLVASTIRPRNNSIERYLSDVRFAKEIYNIELGDQSTVISGLGDLLKSHQLERADDVLQPMSQKIASLAPEAKKLSLHLIGNAHIDMAWLWRYLETIEVTRATFQAAIDNLKAYPDFHFSHGQAHSYQWIEQYHPEMFREIQKYVREGRWEIVGGTWVESDANMPSGESLVRQYLYGKRYFKQKFGVNVKHGFFPDTFGHPSTLPQILSKSGIETYTFFRPGEEERMFWWESPDGSRVFAHHPSNWYGTWSGVPDTVWSAAVRTKTNFSVSNAVQFFGVGDHGGGPTRRQIEQIQELGRVNLYPETKMSTFGSFYSHLVPEKKNAAVERGEQNPAFEGCYTSQARIKLNNRKAEALLPTAEMVSALAMRYGYDYPLRELQEAWQRALFNQFHDILCGSGIHEIYIDSDQFYLEAFERAEAALRGGLRTIAAGVSTTHRSKQATPIVVFNPLNWKRTEPIELGRKYETGRVPRVIDEKGKEIPVQVIERSSDSVTIAFLPKDVPSIGYRTYWISSGRETPVTVSGDLTLENRFFRVEIDKQTGCVSRIYDKSRKREVLSPRALGNQLQIQEDSAPMSAWVIGLRGKPDSITSPRSVRVLQSGKVRKVVRSEYEFENSSFTMDVILYNELPRIDFRCIADWHHRKRILKIAFPVNIADGRATFEVPYGAIGRTTDGREVVAQKWVDLSTNDYEVSLLNDSKYGFDVNGNVIRMTALRAPTDPDPKADEGKHQFSYALCPHARSWEDGSTVRRGYEFNTPMIIVQTDQHHGQLPSSYSFLQLSQPNVVVSTLKKCEDDNGLILRFYETAGKATQAHLQFPQPIVRAGEMDLIEWSEQPISSTDLKEGALNVSLKPFEIKTLKLLLGKEQ